MFEAFLLRHCTKNELTTISGIGDVIAQRILDNAKKGWTWADVGNLPRVGKERLNALKRYIYKKHKAVSIGKRKGFKKSYKF